MIKLYNIERYKNKSLKLLVGILIGTTLTGCSNKISNQDMQTSQEIEKVAEEENTAIYEMEMEDKLETRGSLTIYFKNTEYIDKVNEYVNAKVDSIAFYDEAGNGYGVILSNKETFTTTFLPGDYKFYSKYLGSTEEVSEECTGEFTITNPGEQLTLEIDYQKKTYDIYNNKSNTYKK